MMDRFAKVALGAALVISAASVVFVLSQLRAANDIPDPPFLEYSPLFAELARFARLSGRGELAEADMKGADQCAYKRSVTEFLMQQEEDRKYREEMENRKTGI